MLNTWKHRGINLEADLGGAGGGELGVDPAVDPSQGNDPGNEPQAIQVGEAEYTLDQIQEALKSHETVESRLQEINQRQQEINTMAKAVEASYQQVVGRQPAAQPAQTEPTQMTPESFRDLLWDNPDKAMEVMQDMMRSTSNEMYQTAETERVFFEKNPDYKEVVASPEFQAFRAGLPGYNDVNAYFAYKLEQGQTTAAQSREELTKEIEAEVIKNMQAKGLLNTTLKGPGAAPQPNSQGGPVTAADARNNAIAAIHQNRAAKGMAP